MAVPTIELLTKPGCHLCEDARNTVAHVVAEYKLSFTEIDATQRPDLAEEFAEEIPVLFIDGVQRDFWAIDATRLRKLIEAISAE